MASEIMINAQRRIQRSEVSVKQCGRKLCEQNELSDSCMVSSQLKFCYNCSTSDFQRDTEVSRGNCLPVKMALETMSVLRRLCNRKCSTFRRAMKKKIRELNFSSQSINNFFELEESQQLQIEKRLYSIIVLRE